MITNVCGTNGVSMHTYTIWVNIPYDFSGANIYFYDFMTKLNLYSNLTERTIGCIWNVDI